jgi:hypothetical protein
MTRFDDEVADAAEVTHGNRAPDPIPAATHRDVTADVNRHTEPAVATVSTLEHPDDGANTAGSVEPSWGARFDEGLTRVSTAKAAKPLRALAASSRWRWTPSC